MQINSVWAQIRVSCFKLNTNRRGSFHNNSLSDAKFFFLFLSTSHQKWKENAFSNLFHHSAESAKSIMNIFSVFFFLKFGYHPMHFQSLSSSCWVGKIDNKYLFCFFFFFSEIGYHPKFIRNLNTYNLYIYSTNNWEKSTFARICVSDLSINIFNGKVTKSYHDQIRRRKKKEKGLAFNKPT